MQCFIPRGPPDPAASDHSDNNILRNLIFSMGNLYKPDVPPIVHAYEADLRPLTIIRPYATMTL